MILEQIEKAEGSFEIWATDATGYSLLLDRFDPDDSEDSKEALIVRMLEGLAERVGDWTYSLKF